MKKVPIILSTLTLAAGLNGLGATAMAEGNLSNEAILIEANRVAIGLTTASGELLTNYRDERVWIDNIHPRIGSIVVRSNTADESKALKRIAMMTFNYSLVTMAQADADWMVWDGGNWPYWVQKGRDYTFTEANTDITEIISMDAWGSYNLEMNNRPDVIYFYAELGGWNGEEPEIVRGKVDYRSCVESQMFKDSPYVSFICNNTVDAASNTVTYRITNDRTEVVYPTWAFEYATILSAKIDTIEEYVEDMEKSKADYVRMSDVDRWSAEVREQLSEATGTEELEARLDVLALRARALKERDLPWMLPVEPVDPVDPEEGDDEEGKKEPIIGGGEGDKSDNNNVNEGGGNNDGGISGGSDDKDGESSEGAGTVLGPNTGVNPGQNNGEISAPGSGDNTGANDIGGITEVKKPIDKTDVAAIEPGVTPNKNGETGASTTATNMNAGANISEESDGGEGTNTDDNETRSGNKEQTLEVPNLGGVKERAVWPWIILVLSGVGVLGWWLWRAFGRQKKA